MWGLIIGLGIMATEMIINAFADGPPPPQGANELQLPTVEDGAPYPLIFGRVRIRKPVLVWCDTPIQVLRSAGTEEFYDYYMSMHLVLGIPFVNGQQNIWNVWAGEVEMRQNPFGTATGLGSLVGDGNFEDVAPSHRQVDVVAESDPGNLSSQILATGMVEFLNGNSSQLIVDNVPAYVALTRLGQHMTVAQTVGDFSTYGTVDPRYTGSYRGLMSVFLTGNSSTGHWYVGRSPVAQAYSFEVSTYVTDPSYPSQGLYGKIGPGCNPIDAMYEVCFSTGIGKLGLDPSLCDKPSWQAAAYTMWQEDHEYSRAIEQTTPAADILQEILVQIAGSMFEDSQTGKLAIKLIRPDFNPPDLPVIRPGNGVELKNLTLGGRVGLPNKITVLFTDSTNAYNSGAASAQNIWNVVGQDGIEREL
jgi:Putative phage tail protein